MADGQVIIDILADDKEYQKTVTALNDYTSKSLDVTAKTFSAVGKGMTAAITAPILAVGAFSIKAAIDFESSFAGVRKTTEATEAEFERLAQDAKDMSETKVVSANQINDIMALGSQLGILKENLTDFSSTIADLDVATNLNAEEAATQIAQYANITKMAQTDTDRFGSTIVELGNNMATTEPDIMAFAMRIAGAGSQVGMTDAEILALSGSLASVGLGAEAGGTAISTIMSQIDKDVAQNSESLLIWASTANMSVDQFAAAWQDNALGALQALLKGMDEATASGGNMNLMLDELGISSLRQTDAMKRMSNAADLLSGSVDTANNAWQSNTALANEAAARYMTTESQMAILQNKMTNIASTLGGPLLGSVNALIDGAEPFIGILRDAATGFAEMDDGQRNLIVGAALLAAGLGPIALVGSKILTMTKNVTEGYRGLVAAQKAVTVATAAGTAATTASGAATGYLALATANDTAAKAVNATATGALAAVQRIATVTQHALNAAMAANPVGVVLAGILLLIGALGTLAFVMDNTKTKQERLTRASEQHRGKVVELTRAYEDAAASNGEFSNEAMAAKAALDEETAAFEASKQTLADFVKECDELVEAHQKLMGEIHETVGAADSEAGSILNLLDQMNALVTAGDDTTESHLRMKGIMDALGGSVESLSGVYDEQVGKLALTTEQIQALGVAEADRLRHASRTDEITQLYSEQYGLVAKLAEAEAELVAANERLIQVQDKPLLIIERMQALDNVTLLRDKVDGLRASQAENIETVKGLVEQNKLWFERQVALKKAVADGGSAVLKTDEACEAYGLTLQDVITYEEEVAALQAGEVLQAQIALTAAVEEGKAAIEDYSASHEWFRNAMATSGISSTELATRLADVGMSLDDMTGRFSSSADIIKSSFELLEIDTSHSVDSIQTNLADASTKYASFADDLEFLMGEAGTDAEKAFVAGLADLGVEEGAAIAAELAGQLREGSSEAFSGMAEEMGAKWEEEARIAALAMGTSMSGAVTEAAAVATTAAGEGGTETAQEYTETTSTGITSGAPEIQAAAQSAVDTAISSVDTSAASGIGSQLSAGIAAGIRANSATVESAMADVINAAIARGRAEAVIESPSKRTKKELGLQLGLGIGGGLEESEDFVNRSMTHLMDGVFSSASSGMDALYSRLDLSGFSYDFTAVGTGAALAQGGASSGEVTNNYYTIDGIDMTGDTRVEQAIDVVFSRMRRLGNM